MSNKKHIDRLFQEKFEHFEATPGEEVWHKINERLNNKEERKLVPLWYKMAGVAAVIAVIFTISVSLFFNNSQPQINDSIVVKPSNDDSTDNIIDSINTKEIIPNNEKEAFAIGKDKDDATATTINANTEIIPSNNGPLKNQSLVVKQDPSITTQESIKENNNAAKLQNPTNDAIVSTTKNQLAANPKHSSTTQETINENNNAAKLQKPTNDAIVSTTKNQLAVNPKHSSTTQETINENNNAAKLQKPTNDAIVSTTKNQLAVNPKHSSTAQETIKENNNAAKLQNPTNDAIVSTTKNQLAANPKHSSITQETIKENNNAAKLQKPTNDAIVSTTKNQLATNQDNRISTPKIPKKNSVSPLNLAANKETLALVPKVSNPITVNKEPTEKQSDITNTVKGSDYIMADIPNDDEVLVDVLLSNNNEDTVLKMKNRWSVLPNTSFVYLSSIGKGSSLDSQFRNNTTSSNITMSYGVYTSYSFNKKIKIRTGVNQINLDYNTHDVIAYQGVNTTARNYTYTNHIKNATLNNTSESTIFLSSKNLDYSAIPEIINSSDLTVLEQQLGFLEIPLEIEYTVINKRLGVTFIGGVSSLMLNRNNIYSMIEGNKILVGSANNINNTSFTANLGVGINYNISNNLRANLQPSFKYQINTFNNTYGNFAPYIIGVQTGISYRFGTITKVIGTDLVLQK